MGQLIGMLVKGDAARRVRAPEVRSLACSDHLKEIVYRCIGERRKRYESADELIRALAQPAPSMKGRTVESLQGAHLAFTGTLGVPRSEAAKAARRAGATEHAGASAKVTVVVRGRPNALQAAGQDGGRKLIEIKRLREKGHRIALLSEAHFWRLVLVSYVACDRSLAFSPFCCLPPQRSTQWYAQTAARTTPVSTPPLRPPRQPPAASATGGARPPRSSTSCRWSVCWRRRGSRLTSNALPTCLASNTLPSPRSVVPSTERHVRDRRGAANIGRGV